MEIIEKLKNNKDKMPDLQIRDIKYKNKTLYVFNLQSVSSSEQANDFILKYLSKKSFSKNILNQIKEEIYNYIPSVSLVDIKEDEVFNYLFNGFTILIYEENILAFETKANLDRGVTEPTSEPTIKGPKDSFNENYNTNLGLIRKRIKSENLYIEDHIIGTETNTKVSLIYMENLVDKELLENVKIHLDKIQTDMILDIYYIKELLDKENKTMFPTVKITEKPDLATKNILEGKIIIMCENSNNVMIIPTFFLDFFFSDEDNFQKKAFANFAKIIRILAFFVSIFAPAIYLSLITYDQQMLPTSLLINFATQRQSVPFPAIIEAAVLIFTFEILYEGDALTPPSRGTALSILGALVLGDAAVNAGVVSPIMVIVIAISAICSLFFIYYDVQSFFRVYRYALMILASIAGMIGIIIGFVFMMTNLCSVKSFGKPFMLPLSPKLNIKNRKKLIKKGLIAQNTYKGEI